ncbi:UNKNOWN [Stylonychia lemnae]|uniref:Uncharacterized protein n=1 Tax=Stylonychia lemnae TaxID=5949 RepID=A0A078AGA7_STYLE|nr:UNKNOWN [Stylonychia lemnae]|eukprot:CDW81335.1 UNKNOWN [Stylonychia lemnae]
MFLRKLQHTSATYDINKWDQDYNRFIKHPYFVSLNAGGQSVLNSNSKDMYGSNGRINSARVMSARQSTSSGLKSIRNTNNLMTDEQIEKANKAQELMKGQNELEQRVSQTIQYEDNLQIARPLTASKGNKKMKKVKINGEFQIKKQNIKSMSNSKAKEQQQLQWNEKIQSEQVDMKQEKAEEGINDYQEVENAYE